MLKRMIAICLILLLSTGCSKKPQEADTAAPSQVVEGAQEPDQKPATPAPTPEPADEKDEKDEKQETPPKKEEPEPSKPTTKDPVTSKPEPADPKPADPESEEQEPGDQEPEEEKQKPVTIPKLKPDPNKPVTANWAGAIATIEDGVLAMDGDTPTLTVTFSYTNIGTRKSAANFDMSIYAEQLEFEPIWYSLGKLHESEAYNVFTEVGESQRFTITFELESLDMDTLVVVQDGPFGMNGGKAISKWFRVVK